MQQGVYYSEGIGRLMNWICWTIFSKMSTTNNSSWHRMRVILIFIWFKTTLKIICFSFSINIKVFKMFPIKLRTDSNIIICPIDYPVRQLIPSWNVQPQKKCLNTTLLQRRFFISLSSLCYHIIIFYKLKHLMETPMKI